MLERCEGRRVDQHLAARRPAPVLRVRVRVGVRVRARLRLIAGYEIKVCAVATQAYQAVTMGMVSSELTSPPIYSPCMEPVHRLQAHVGRMVTGLRSSRVMSRRATPNYPPR